MTPMPRLPSPLAATLRRCTPAEAGLLWAALALLVLACLPQRAGALALNLFAVIAWYGAAKLVEAADHAVFAATGQWVSGHTLKHLNAAGAALPVLVALHAMVTARVQNGAPCRPCEADVVRGKGA